MKVKICDTIKGKYSDCTEWEFQLYITGFATTNFSLSSGMRVRFQDSDISVSRKIKVVDALVIDHGGGRHWDQDVELEGLTIKKPEVWTDLISFLWGLRLERMTFSWTKLSGHGEVETPHYIGERAISWLPEEFAEFLCPDDYRKTLNTLSAICP